MGWKTSPQPISPLYLLGMTQNILRVLHRQTDILDRLFAAFLRRADEGTLSRLLVEVSVLLASERSNGTSALRDAATAYKIDSDAIGLKVKQEFAAKEKA